MPNPFIRLGGQVQSKPVDDRPEATPPVLEHYAGTNNPYRGIEDHGVKSNNDPTPPGMWADNHTGFHYADEEPAQDPIDVRIVNQYQRELRKCRVHVMSVSNIRTQQFVGRNEARQSITFRNNDAVLSVYVGTTIGMNIALNGFELKPGQDLTLFTEDELYVLGTAVDPAVQRVQAIEQYSVRE